MNALQARQLANSPDPDKNLDKAREAIAGAARQKKYSVMIDYNLISDSVAILRAEGFDIEALRLGNGPNVMGYIIYW